MPAGCGVWQEQQFSSCLRAVLRGKLGPEHHYNLRFGLMCLCAGMPVGLQLIGPAWSEARLLQAGSILESALKSSNRLPATWYDVLFGKEL